MDFGLTDEQSLLIESVREMMARGNYESYFRECDDEGVLPQKAIDDAVELGFEMCIRDRSLPARPRFQCSHRHPLSNARRRVDRHHHQRARTVLGAAMPSPGLR